MLPVIVLDSGRDLVDSWNARRSQAVTANETRVGCVEAYRLLRRSSGIVQPPWLPREESGAVSPAYGRRCPAFGGSGGVQHFPASTASGNLQSCPPLRTQVV